jgi:hypothetical protein
MGSAVLAVILSAIASMIVGSLWYGPLFGKQWMSLMGITKKVTPQMKAKARTSYIWMFILSLITASVLWCATTLYNQGTVFCGTFWGILAWVGFVMPTVMGGYLWESKPMKLVLINLGFQLVNLAIMGTIVGAVMFG